MRGACSAEILGETPEEMGENSKRHVMEMVQAGDANHKAAIEDMMKLRPKEQQKWYKGFKNSFDSLPDA